MPTKRASAEQTVSEATQLHLFLSIVLLLLMTRIWGLVPDTFGEALFACISMPALYAMTYYTARRYKTIVSKFIRTKTGEPVVLSRKVELTSELVAILASYFMGFIVFVSFTGEWDFITYTSAFLAIQLMRLLIIEISAYLQKIDVDVQHPIVIVLIALASATLALFVLSGFFYVFVTV